MDWQTVKSAPLEQKVLLGYFGPDDQMFGAMAVAKPFQWERMQRPLFTGWPWTTCEPSHWMPLPEPPSQS